MTSVCGLIEVDEFIVHEISKLYPEGANVSMRACDLCGVAAVDLADGFAIYFDPAEFLNVCGNCSEEYLKEKPS